MTLKSEKDEPGGSERERDLNEIYLDACFDSARVSDPPDLERVRACLLLGADVNWTDRQTGSGSGLQMAAKINSVEPLELLLSDPAVSLNFWGMLRPLTPLDLACEV